ncbi:MAG: CapA family protein [bacterium]
MPDTITAQPDHHPAATRARSAAGVTRRSVWPLLLTLLCGAVLFGSCAKSPPPTDIDITEVPYLIKSPPGLGPDAIWQHLPWQRSEAVLAFSGDVLMHGRVRQCAASHNRTDGWENSSNNEGFDFLFEHLGPVWRDADLTLVNLETPVAPASGDPGRPFVFNVSPALLDALSSSGVDLVTLANNHAFDQGGDGLAETIAHLQAAGLRQVGAGVTSTAAQVVLIEEINDIRLGFLGFSQLLNADLNVEDPLAPHINVLERQQVLDAIAAARSQVDFLVLTVHWGVEYAAEVRELEKSLAHEFLEAGADAIIGHHPHVIQPLELYETADGRLCLVAYSLGNLISNQSRKYIHGITPAYYGATRDGLILKLRVGRVWYNDNVERTELRGVGFIPLFTENNYYAQFADSTLPTTIQPVPNDLRIEQLVARIRSFDRAAAQNATKNSPALDTRELIRLKQELALYVDRKQGVVNLLGDEYYLPYRPPVP